MRVFENEPRVVNPLPSQYLWEEFGVFSKRIDEKRSSNKRARTATAGCTQT